jgi:multicomponent Na+:H+ antiporter subunit D
LFLSVPTMIFGILGALKRTTIREILCFNLISHIGFMMFAIGLFSEESIAATIFYVIHHVIVIASLFFLAGLIETKTGSGELSKIGNIWQKAPVLSFFFLIQCLSLAGIPPLSGFWGKWMMIREGLTVGADIFVAVLIIASILTVWSLLRILLNGIWNTSPKGEENSSPIISTKNHPLALTTSVIVAISLIIGLNPNPIIKIARQTSANLFNQFEYAEQVLSYQGVRLPEGHVPADTDLLNELNEDSH